MIGEFPQALWKERLSAHFSQSAENRLRRHLAGGDLIFDHVFAKLRKITHWSLRSDGDATARTAILALVLQKQGLTWINAKSR